jgi:lysozyme
MIIDVSKWQGDVNWLKVKAAGVDSAFLKASQGINYMDPRVLIESREAVAVGVKIGYYHFASLNDKKVVQDAKAEAQYFVKVIKTLPKADLPLILDIEENKLGISPIEVLNWVKTFFMELEALGYKDYALYSYTPFLDKNLPANHGLGGVKLWLAAYKAKPDIPKGWVDYWLWQYSNKGRINGINADVDLNKY